MQYLETLHEGENADSGDQPTSDHSKHPPQTRPDKKPKSSTGSFLLDYWLAPEDDEANHVIVRTEHGMILLNKYPYTNGHLLIALGDARPSLSDYEPQQRTELWQLVDRAVALCERALEPQGLNIGINQGVAGGAGVPSHLHVHVMPRWVGDTNFISTVGGVRVIPSALEMMYDRYAQAVNR
jgi:ATP adenylyltransferase